MGTDDRYFLKVGRAPERGPMSRDELINALVPGLTRRNALVRVESSVPAVRGYQPTDPDWAPPDASLISAVEEREALTQQSTSRERAANEELARKYIAERFRYGLIKIALGATLSLASYLYAVSAGGGIYIIFTGLTLWGIIDIVRAMSLEP
jgi:hypothetical protein